MQADELLTQIREPVAHDLKDLDNLILSELHSDIPLIQMITQHIVHSGGKRLRPLLVILCARAAGKNSNTEHLELAAIIEFVHTATLLHDDVIDGSSLRRGKETANAVYGNQASILVGDFLYSRSFQMLTRRSNISIMKTLSDTTNVIAEGEVLQLMNCNNPEATEENYYDIIKRKTAKLFESACETGAMLGSSNKEIHCAAATYGLHIGFAFQIIDDILDYTSTPKEMGKNVGDDLAEGKPTLPLIYTLQHAGDDIKLKIKHSIEKSSCEFLDEIIKAMHTHSAFTYCLEQAHKHLKVAKDALLHFKDTSYRAALDKLLQFVTERTF